MVSYSFTHWGKPKVKERPRSGSSGSRLYTPKTTLDAQKALAASYEGPLFEGRIRVKSWFYPDRTEVLIDDYNDCDVPVSPLRGDIDNYKKLVLDGLEGIAYPNDRMVMAISAAKCV